MFLNQLTEPLHKALFRELAMLVMMAEGSRENSVFTAEEIEEMSILGLFMQNISEEETKVMYEYSKELALEEFDPELRAYDKDLDIKHGYEADVDDDTLRLDDETIEKIEEALSDDEDIHSAYGHFYSYLVILIYALNKILALRAQEESIREAAIKKLIVSGEDILNPSPLSMQKMILSLPGIQQEVLELTAKYLIDTKRHYLNLSAREIKIILFELIGAGFSSGRLENEERQLIDKICGYLNADAEYIDEFIDVMGRIFVAHKEAAELINE